MCMYLCTCEYEILVCNLAVAQADHQLSSYRTRKNNLILKNVRFSGEGHQSLHI